MDCQIVIGVCASVFSEVGLAVAFMDKNAMPETKEMRAALASRDPERIRATRDATTGFRPDDGQLEEIMTTLGKRT